MFIKILKFLLAGVLAISLTACGELAFPTTEDGFPIGFTRVSDGVQVYLGMHRDDVLRILGEPTGVAERRFAYSFMMNGEYVGSMELHVNDDGRIRWIHISSWVGWDEWVTVGGLYAGMDSEELFEIFDNGELSYFHNFYDSDCICGTYGGCPMSTWVVDNPENPVYTLSALAGLITINRPDAEFWAHHGYPRAATD